MTPRPPKAKPRKPYSDVRWAFRPILFVITDRMAELAAREFSAQKGESFDAMWNHVDEADKREVLDEWKAILAEGLGGKSDAEPSAPTSEARKQFDGIMEDVPTEKCLHGVVFGTICEDCVNSDEFDPVNVLPFCDGAIRDAIGLEDGLDGRAGEGVLHMIATSLERARRIADKARETAEQSFAPTTPREDEGWRGVQKIELLREELSVIVADYGRALFKKHANKLMLSDELMLCADRYTTTFDALCDAVYAVGREARVSSEPESTTAPTPEPLGFVVVDRHNIPATEFFLKRETADGECRLFNGAHNQRHNCPFAVVPVFAVPPVQTPAPERET